MTVNKNTDFNDKNTIHHNNSKTLISYSSNIYTDKYLKYISEDTIKETREKLKNIYCASGSFHKLSPQERLFYEARKQRKSIILHYYADSGETLIFNIGVSLNHLKCLTHRITGSTVYWWRNPEQVIAGYQGSDIMHNTITGITIQHSCGHINDAIRKTK